MTAKSKNAPTPPAHVDPPKALPPEGRLALIRAEQKTLRTQLATHSADSAEYAEIYNQLVALAKAEVEAREAMVSDMLGDSRLQRIARGSNVG